METPNNEAGRITEEVMLALDPKRLASTEVYNRAYEANYALLTELIEATQKKIVAEKTEEKVDAK